MKFIADLHIHSKYSRATSRELNLENLYIEAKKKGITLIATGDMTHPQWQTELKEKLEPAEDGLFKLKHDITKALNNENQIFPSSDIRFILSGEISTIYKKGDKVRKVHSVVILPDFDSLETFTKKLNHIGNLKSDGRPILGLDAKNLLEISLESSSDCIFIPAHIWTPWFSVLGSKSGFDSIEECFEELTPNIYAVETGLSSDPLMNWRVSSLDKFVLVSNSDAHSAEKLGREANIFNCELSYSGIFDSLKNKKNFIGTIEFYPEEGKYHFDGHRKCDLRIHPNETQKYNGRCPKCGGKITVGVMYRVEELADRVSDEKPETAFNYYSLIPLKEILAQCLGTGDKSKKVDELYHKMISNLGVELQILQEVPVEDINQKMSPLIGEAIRRVRTGEIFINPGYDGEYGEIKIFNPDERNKFLGQTTFLDSKNTSQERLKIKTKDKETKQTPIQRNKSNKKKPSNSSLFQITDSQKQAIESTAQKNIIIAGPGTGKTLTLTLKISNFLKKGFLPENILAITFTNKAAFEMKERLSKYCSADYSERIFISTFHGLGLNLIKKYGNIEGWKEPITIMGSLIEEKTIENLKKKFNLKYNTKTIIKGIEDTKSNLSTECSKNPEWNNFITEYITKQKESGFVDFTDLITIPTDILSKHEQIRNEVQNQYKAIFIDEFQDINEAQYKFILNLINDDTNLTVIGDPDQAIYGFRGASPKFFNLIKSRFPETNEVQLKDNFRSQPVILKAGSQLLEKTESLNSNFTQNINIHTIGFPSSKSESIGVAHLIQSLLGGATHYSVDSGLSKSEIDEELHFNEIAVLARTKFLLEEISNALQIEGIPHRSYGENSLTDKKGIQLLIASLQYIRDKEKNKQLKEIIPQQIINNIELIKTQPEKSQIIEAGKILELDKESLEYLEFNFISSKLSYEDWLNQICLNHEIDISVHQADYVNLLTLHAVKGLEYKAVIISGCEQGLIPLKIPGNECDLQEEKRLFYVGITRAKKYLFLTWSKNRTIKGQNTARIQSPFLQNISEELFTHQEKILKPAKPKQLSLFD